MSPDEVEASATGRIGRAVKNTFISLRTRNFRLYFFGQIISNTGNWLTNVAMTLFVLHLTNSGLAVGALAACQFGPILFLSVWGGAIADRGNKRKLLMLTQSLEMLQSVCLAVLAAFPHPPLAALYVLAGAGGILLAFDNPLRRSFVNEMVPAKDVPNAVVIYSMIVNTSRIFGPALAGLLVVTLNYAWCFAIDAASYLAVLYGLYRMRPAEFFTQPRAAKGKGAIRESFKYILATPILWVGFVMLAAIGTLAYNFNVTLPLFVTGALHQSNATYTILYSFFSIGAVISGLIVAHRGLVRMRHIVYGAAALGVAMLMLAAAPSLAVAIPVAVVLGIASILYMTATTAIVQVETKPEMRGRVLALQMVFVAGTTPIGGPVLGWLADHAGGRAPIMLGGIVCLVAAGFGYGATRYFAGSKAPI